MFRGCSREERPDVGDALLIFLGLSPKFLCLLAEGQYKGVMQYIPLVAAPWWARQLASCIASLVGDDSKTLYWRRRVGGWLSRLLRGCIGEEYVG